MEVQKEMERATCRMKGNGAMTPTKKYNRVRISFMYVIHGIVEFWDSGIGYEVSIKALILFKYLSFMAKCCGCDDSVQASRNALVM